MANEKKSRTAKSLRIKKFQREVTEKLLQKLDEKFLTREEIKLRLLSSRKSDDEREIDIVSRLDLIDAVRENLKTSLQFEDYRRATRYLAMLDFLCQKFLN